MIKKAIEDLPVLIMSHTGPPLSGVSGCRDMLCCYSHIALHCDISQAAERVRPKSSAHQDQWKLYLMEPTLSCSLSLFLSLCVAALRVQLLNVTFQGVCVLFTSCLLCLRGSVQLRQQTDIERKELEYQARELTRGMI